MKYVKAHKETLRPFRREGGWGGRRGTGGCIAQEARKIHCVSKNEKRAKALSIRISRDVNGRGDEKKQEERNAAVEKWIALFIMGHRGYGR